MKVIAFATEPKGGFDKMVHVFKMIIGGLPIKPLSISSNHPLLLITSDHNSFIQKKYQHPQGG